MPETHKTFRTGQNNIRIFGIIICLLQLEQHTDRQLPIKPVVRLSNVTVFEKPVVIILSNVKGFEKTVVILSNVKRFEKPVVLLSNVKGFEKPVVILSRVKGFEKPVVILSNVKVFVLLNASSHLFFCDFFVSTQEVKL